MIDPLGLLRAVEDAIDPPAAPLVAQHIAYASSNQVIATAERTAAQVATRVFTVMIVTTLTSGSCSPPDNSVIKAC